MRRERARNSDVHRLDRLGPVLLRGRAEAHSEQNRRTVYRASGDPPLRARGVRGRRARVHVERLDSARVFLSRSTAAPHAEGKRRVHRTRRARAAVRLRVRGCVLVRVVTVLMREGVPAAAANARRTRVQVDGVACMFVLQLGCVVELDRLRTVRVVASNARIP